VTEVSIGRQKKAYGWAFQSGTKRRKETAMDNTKDILLVVDYHARNCQVRWFNCFSGEERQRGIPTTREGIGALVDESAGEARANGAGARVRWIMESTTGWARVKDLLQSRAQFVLANVLQMPLPPKARRRKSDKIDTARMLREELNGTLPRSYPPGAWWRRVRRVVDCRLGLVRRTTAVKNWISSYLHHETWQERTGLWSGVGMRRLRRLRLPGSDRLVMDLKLDELEHLQGQLRQVEGQIRAIYDAWPAAQRLDEVRGVGMVTAVSVLAHVGPIQRFGTAEDLISYAGLAPGLRQSDGVRHNGRIGGGGTDSQLRYLLIESSTWLCQIPRYRPTYERVLRKRGKNIARIVVARMFLRSVHKMLKDNLRFNPAPRRPKLGA
jgi:transposase